MSSPAVSLSAVSRVLGYTITPANFNPASPLLPQRIALFAEINDANQAASLTPVPLTSAQQAGNTWGWGSPMHQAARLFFPATGAGSAIPGISIIAYPMLAGVGAAANVQTITVTGTATANVTHTVLIAGRELLEGGTYEINIVTGDTATAIATKIKNAINAVLGCPVGATSAAGVVTLTTKWSGITSQGTTIYVLTNGNAAGASYAVAQVTAGSGFAQLSLSNFGNEWNTIVVNGYGDHEFVTKIFTNFNGNPNTGTGQYDPTIMKPFICITGTVLDSNPTDADTVFADAAKVECTIAFGPAPMSLGYPIEAAVNAAIEFANISNNTPNIDVAGLSYNDMPLPLAGNVPQTSAYTVRDAIVKMGMSTAQIINGAYQIQDFVTTYHPDGEYPPSFRYPRDLMIDFNIKFQFYLFLAQSVWGKQIANDGDIVTAGNVIKPKDVKAGMATLAKNYVAQGFISDAAFTISNTTVAINSTNANRFDITFSYERSGVVRIVSTNANAGFNNGN